MEQSTLYAAVIPGAITVIVAIIGILGNWYLSNQNKKMELVMKTKEIEQKEYQFLLENLKGFWEYQNGLYSETLKTVSVLVLNDDVTSVEFLGAYKRFWELYWSELPTCESKEIATAMALMKNKIHDKKHISAGNKAAISDMKEGLKKDLLNLATAVRNSSLLLEYSERIKAKIKSNHTPVNAN